MARPKSKAKLDFNDSKENQEHITPSVVLIYK